MAYKIIGSLTYVGPIVQKTEKFRLREIVILVDKKTRNQELSYPVKLQVTGDRCDQLDSLDFREALKYEMNLEIEFEISGRTWRDSQGNVVIFNSLTAIFLKILDRVRTPSPAAQATLQPNLGFDDPKPWTPVKPAYIAPDAQHVIDDLPF